MTCGDHLTVVVRADMNTIFDVFSLEAVTSDDIQLKFLKYKNELNKPFSSIITIHITSHTYLTINFQSTTFILVEV